MAYVPGMSSALCALALLAWYLASRQPRRVLPLTCRVESGRAMRARAAAVRRKVWR